ncbi:hypothetical protein KC349_g3478 [Hortaea werneckii]|nr:hypothetical protein KC349_g3478 [Hortaea werneckii]
MAYVFPLNIVYASKEGGVKTYRLVPRELVPRERGISSRPETPEPDESIEGTVIERTPTPPYRPDTPERLPVTPCWKAFTQRASQAEFGKTNTIPGVLLGDPERQDG